MNYDLVLKNGHLVNRGEIFQADIAIKNKRIVKIDKNISASANLEHDLKGNFLFPGAIDDQVHFREPGLTHKATIYTESRAAVAGGVTSFMEMPNTMPPAITQELLEDKYRIARDSSLANYSFFMGTSNENIEEVLKTPMDKVCGLKIFMGSSTGNMLVDDAQTLENIFSKVDMLIATHCEDEETIRRNLQAAREKYGENIPMEMHPVIRSVEACYKSSSLAAELARKHGARLHILHITTEKELSLFDESISLKDRKITAEVCVHHLTFDASQYGELGSKIKCNPAIKEKRHRKALLEGLKNGKFAVIATDHAPHTFQEKSSKYLQAPSGLPLVQHSIPMMLQLYHSGELELPFIVEKMSHAPAELFEIDDRGYVEEEYYADLVEIDIDEEWTVKPENIYYKCGWSPLEGKSLKGRIKNTWVNGHHTYKNGEFDESQKGMRLSFTRRLG